MGTSRNDPRSFRSWDRSRQREGQFAVVPGRRRFLWLITIRRSQAPWCTEARSEPAFRLKPWRHPGMPLDARQKYTSASEPQGDRCCPAGRFERVVSARSRARAGRFLGDTACFPGTRPTPFRQPDAANQSRGRARRQCRVNSSRAHGTRPGQATRAAQVLGLSRISRGTLPRGG